MLGFQLSAFKIVTGAHHYQPCEFRVTLWPLLLLARAANNTVYNVRSHATF